MEDILVAWIFSLMFLGSMVAGKVAFKVASQRIQVVSVVGWLLLAGGALFIYLLDPTLAVGFLAGFWHEVVIRRSAQTAPVRMVFE